MKRLRQNLKRSFRVLYYRISEIEPKPYETVHDIVIPVEGFEYRQLLTLHYLFESGRDTTAVHLRYLVRLSTHSHITC